MKMSFVISSILAFTAPALCDNGPAFLYKAPYTPLKCGQFDTGKYFAAVGVNFWDNGGACGRMYDVRCIAGTGHPCKGGRTGKGPKIRFTVVNYHDGRGFYLSPAAMGAIQNGAGMINVEFNQV